MFQTPGYGSVASRQLGGYDTSSFSPKPWPKACTLECMGPCHYDCHYDVFTLSGTRTETDTGTEIRTTGAIGLDPCPASVVGNVCKARLTKILGLERVCKQKEADKVSTKHV